LYYAHFGLKQPPFKITPNTEFFFSGANRGAVLDALVYAVSSGEGIVKVVGEVGSGKTMLCRMLETSLPENIESVYLANPSVAPEDILHAIAFELQLPLPENADRLQVMHALQKYLLERHGEKKQVVIFVEEAQGMPLPTLEEMRLLSNLETRHDKLLQIVLFGQPELDANLNDPQIRQLRERITHSFNLGPLGESEIGDYLIFRLRTAGYFGPHLFTKGALRKIGQASKGLVRRINILADKALLAAFAENAYSVTPKHVRVAIQDSEFGTEQTRLVSGKKAYWMAAATLLAGLGLGVSLHKLVTTDHEPPQPPVKAIVKSAPKPATSVLPTATTTKESLPPPDTIQRPSTPPVVPQLVKIHSAAEPAPPATELQKKDESQSAQFAPTPTDILDARLLATQQWLGQQPASTISIQIIGADNEQQLRGQMKYIGSIIDNDKVFVYRTRVGEKPFLTVLYGNFNDKTTAYKAISELPKVLSIYRPRLRTVGGIKEEIKQLQ